MRLFCRSGIGWNSAFGNVIDHLVLDGEGEPSGFREFHFVPPSPYSANKAVLK